MYNDINKYNIHVQTKPEWNILWSFIQQKIDFGNEDVKFLWSFDLYHNNGMHDDIINMCKTLENNQELLNMCNNSSWKGCFGVMSVIKWEFLDIINKKHNFFGLLKKINTRETRQILERVFSIISYTNSKMNTSYFGDIHSYIKWGLTFIEYVTNDCNYPIVKVWSGR